MSTRQRLTHIAESIVEGEFRITELWAVVGDQRNAEWHLKIYRDPVIQFVLPDGQTDENIAATIRARLEEAV